MRCSIGRAGAALVLVLAAAALPLSATITHLPAQPNVDQTVTFNLVVSATVLSAVWDFGDGTTSHGLKTVTKVYRSAGTYHVKVDYQTFAAKAQDATSITVVELRKITYAPSSPQVNQTVVFQAVNFLSTSIRWDFGDGSAPVMAGASPTHTYTFPGSFQVKAWDLGGTSMTAISAAITIGLDTSARRVEASPPTPAAGRPVTLSAVHFFTTNILWDFGDGTPAAPGPPQVVHTYASPGKYLVQAWDWAGAYGGPTTLTLEVNVATGPLAAFQVFFLQLRFDDGKAYKVVPKDFPTLTAYADLKYEGTGLFRAQWMVDGTPFRIVTKALTFAAETTVDTSVVPGQSDRLPGLPTNLPGMHEVTLRIFEPAPDFIVPVIRYFVSADSSVRPADLEGLRVDLESCRGVEGVSCALTAEGLEVPAGRYAILTGSLTYNRPQPVKFALLRVYLEDRLVDQQFLRDLVPGERRSFETSILNPSAEPRRLYLTVYALEGSKAELIFFQKMWLLPKG
jgi:hypothetical protein